MLRILIPILILLTTNTLADPPDIACLTGFTIDETFSTDQVRPGNGIVILVDNQFLQSEDSWDRSVWNNESFAQQLNDRRVKVVYINGKSHPAIFALLNPSSTPAAYYFNYGQIKAKRFGYRSADTPELMMEWIKQAEINSSLSKQMINQLKAAPDDIALRTKLIQELGREDNQAEMDRQLSWLFDHNETWFQYLIEHDLSHHNETENQENHFRSSLLWFIMSTRDSLSLFRQNKPESEGAQIKDGWQEAIAILDDDKNDSEYKARLEIYFLLRHTLEARRDNSTATDRDLFTLKVLTAEGQETRELIDQYAPYFK